MDQVLGREESLLHKLLKYRKGRKGDAFWLEWRRFAAFEIHGTCIYIFIEVHNLDTRT